MPVVSKPGPALAFQAAADGTHGGCETTAYFVTASMRLWSWQISDKCNASRRLFCRLCPLTKFLIEFEPPACTF